MDINLRLINHSNNAADASVVIFQKNLAVDPHVVAWDVIRHVGVGFAHPFTYPNVPELEVHDVSNGFRQRVPARMGRQLVVRKNEFGNIWLDYEGNATGPDLIAVHNLTNDVIEASIYRNGQVVAVLSNVSPQVTAMFSVPVSLFLGVLPDIQEGSIIDPTTVSSFTELPLAGVSSADIAMNDGDSAAKPYKFSLENVTHG